MKLNYENPYVRLARRFVVVAVSASLAVFLQLTVQNDGLAFWNSVTWLSGTDWLSILYSGLGAGFLAMLDKLSRELDNLKK